MNTELHYIEPLYRPPSEGKSLILQVALGCPNNSCDFCKMYKKREYELKPFSLIQEEIRQAADIYGGAKRIFLADGDVMYLPFPELEAILLELNSRFPGLIRVGVYANGSSILKKSDEELRRLRELKLGIGYLGLESGSDEILRDMHKHEKAAEMTEAVMRARDAGIKMSVMVLMGLGGRDKSALHVEKTAEVLKRMQPGFLAALTVIPEPGTRLYRRVQEGRFQLMDTREILIELKSLIAELELTSTVFRCNHASNPLPLAGRFPRDKDYLLAEIDSFL